MELRLLLILISCILTFAEEYHTTKRTKTSNIDVSMQEEPPEGYYAFVESPNAEPPKVKSPPYVESDKECHDTGKGKGYASVYNICGDLNKGFIPKNPMKQYINGSSYPFTLIKNHTLKFLSKALPILKADESLPKVAKIQPVQNSVDPDRKRSRNKRSSDINNNANRNGRKFCENGSGVVIKKLSFKISLPRVCMLYKAIQGEPLAASAAERRDEPSTQEYHQRNPVQEKPEYTGPPTPCPAKVEYATPVFAKNYQGVWRYVVQIPYEGYFTQTIEVTRCMQSRCHYLDGGCLSSPRWTSLLVAEIFYPETFLEGSQSDRFPGPRDPVVGVPPPVHDFQNYQQYLQKRAGENEARNSGSSQQHHCDGVDEMGCFQVRLYYDWFLIPGSCKCWRPDYFNRYVRRSGSSTEL
ncbi:hypothetical protein V1477_008545 [Vespula maculifrons]|uniref:Uncharacterized protein n=1 Tax=Vespula maculifrons TaxID=7453 RepID=A0ABD2CDC9_VESMC